jgi:hypothetical protein
MSTFDFEDEYEDDDEHDVKYNQVSYKRRRWPKKASLIRAGNYIFLINYVVSY